MLVGNVLIPIDKLNNYKLSQEFRLYIPSNIAESTVLCKIYYLLENKKNICKYFEYFPLQICSNCKPVEEHIRLFDTTERTGLRRHKTRRQCRHCGGDLKDSIVHFGEKGPFHSPYNWREASRVADQADLVLCLGSSLKVRESYCYFTVVDQNV